MRHLLGIAAATALIILCTLLPFLPGRYDGMAVPLSAMAQVVGTVGLVLVPVGALWMAPSGCNGWGRSDTPSDFLPS